MQFGGYKLARSYYLKRYWLIVHWTDGKVLQQEAWWLNKLCWHLNYVIESIYYARCWDKEKPDVECHHTVYDFYMPLAKGFWYGFRIMEVDPVISKTCTRKMVLFVLLSCASEFSGEAILYTLPNVVPMSLQNNCHVNLLQSVCKIDHNLNFDLFWPEWASNRDLQYGPLEPILHTHQPGKLTIARGLWWAFQDHNDQNWGISFYSIMVKLN